MIVWPVMLIVVPLALTAALGAAWFRGGRSRESDRPAMRRMYLVGGRPAEGATARRSSWRFWSALIVLAVAAARPQLEPPERAGEIDAEVILAIDLTRDMVESGETRITAMRETLLEIAAAASADGARTGLIGFAEHLHWLAEPSADPVALERFLQTLRVEHLDEIADDAGTAGLAAADVIDEAKPTGVVVLAVAGNTQADAAGFVRTVRARGMALVALQTGEASSGDIPAMRSVVQAGDGLIVPADDAQAAVSAVRSALADARSEGVANRLDLFFWLILGGAGLLVWSLCVELPARPRRRARPTTAIAVTALMVFCAAPPGLLAGQPSPFAQPVHLHGEEDPFLAAMDVLARITTDTFCLITYQTDVAICTPGSFKRLYEGLNHRAYKTAGGFLQVGVSITVSHAGEHDQLDPELMLHRASRGLESSRQNKRIIDQPILT